MEEKNSNYLKRLEAFQAIHSSSTAKVLMACKINTERKSLFKGKGVESIVKQ